MFLAERADNGEVIAAHELSEANIKAWQAGGRRYGELPLACPDCRERVTVVQSHRRNGHFVACHFRHINGRGGGGSAACGGESDRHRRMKSIVISKLRAMFSNAIKSIDDEYMLNIDGGDLGRETQRRHIDVAITFDQSIGTADQLRDRIDCDGPGYDEDTDTPIAYDGRIGDRLAIECQHRHKSKDVQRITKQYLHAGWSVLWLYDEHFETTGGSGDADLGAGDWIPVWPNVLPKKKRGEFKSARELLDDLRIQHDLVMNIPSREDMAWQPVVPTNTRIHASIPLNWYRDELRDAYETGLRIKQQTDVQARLKSMEENGVWPNTGRAYINEGVTGDPTIHPADDRSSSVSVEVPATIRNDLLADLVERTYWTKSLSKRFNELGVDIRCPNPPLSIVRERVKAGEVCTTFDHEWIELNNGYWRECRVCGLADVTCRDLGQPIPFPNADEEEGPSRRG